MTHAVRRISGAFALLAIFSSHAHAAAQRWNVDIYGLKEASVSLYGYGPGEGPPPPAIVDRHGYFIGDDLDGNGQISSAELLDLQLLGFTAPLEPMRSHFNYNPASGLTFSAGLSQGGLNFGTGLYSVGSGVDYKLLWIDSTRTEITASAVPEASSAASFLSGLLMIGWLARRGKGG